eukprot:CAMPEP_0168613360 /NCGR_PEP_ID=MMETSP0449_2-20121227/3409_1 /TAXON_ID=1082188 /ORGANISM="Strombidium rassoulzadegani, Strain ras09" /LENGTH=163 /DNA_ID=CAMNT_0008653987 /DNA_START=38 /DNA_END=530 /DNA_ORIENTATION=+
MDVKGGGLTHYELGNMKYMRCVYGEGLRVPKTMNRAWDREKYFYQKSAFAKVTCGITDPMPLSSGSSTSSTVELESSSCRDSWSTSESESGPDLDSSPSPSISSDPASVKESTITMPTTTSTSLTEPIGSACLLRSGEGVLGLGHGRHPLLPEAPSSFPPNNI